MELIGPVACTGDAIDKMPHRNHDHVVLDANAGGRSESAYLAAASHLRPEAWRLGGSVMCCENKVTFFVYLVAENLMSS